MKILFTGGVTGGHFYPIIAVAQTLRQQAKEKKVLQPTLYYMAPTPYNPRALFDNEIIYVRVPCGKMRRYFSLLNFTDIFKTIYGCAYAIIKMFTIYPDVVFGKGGYGSFPALLAARLFRIPVIIHESDSRPGRVNAWAGKFARKIAISYPGAAKFFKAEKVAYTGNPIRPEIIDPLVNGAQEFLHLEPNTPTVFIMGGSQGSQNINDVVIDALPEMLNRYQIIHQVGKANFDNIKATTGLVLKDHQFSYRYHPFDYMNELALRMSAGAANVVVSRAGSTIFEIASWGLPSILIPLSPEVGHDQIHNANAYAETGACSIIEENNLSAHILIEEIDRITGNKVIQETMRKQAQNFARKDSSRLVADAILNIALEHEK